MNIQCFRALLGTLALVASPAGAQCPDFSTEFGIPGGLPNANCLLRFDDGSGPAMYLGGQFTNLNGAGIDNIARWDGNTLSGLGTGVNGTVDQMCSFDGGSGPVLVVSGSFTLAGGGAASRIACWNGMSWRGLGSGLNSPAYSLAEYDDGTGPALYAGGDFTSSGATTIYRLAKWKDGVWSQVANGALSGPRCMRVWDDGTGPALYFGGAFDWIGGLPAANGFAKLQGSTWTSLISGTKNGPVDTIVPFDDGSGPSFFLGGRFTVYNGVNAQGILRWQNGVISPVSFGFQNTPSPSSMAVSVLSVHDDGAGPRLYAGGTFDRSGPTLVPSIARWNGAFFQGLGAGLSSRVGALCSFDSGSGPTLWAAGNITATGSSPMTGTVRWNAGAWSTIVAGKGLNNEVDALRALDGPSGPALFATGTFTGAGGFPNINRVARWDGSQWSALGTGLDTAAAAIEAFDAGGGRRIAVGGA